jgi:hypothetical protein
VPFPCHAASGRAQAMRPSGPHLPLHTPFVATARPPSPLPLAIKTRYSFTCAHSPFAMAAIAVAPLNSLSCSRPVPTNHPRLFPSIPWSHPHRPFSFPGQVLIGATAPAAAAACLHGPTLHRRLRPNSGHKSVPLEHVVLPHRFSGQERRRARWNPAARAASRPKGHIARLWVFPRSFLQTEGIYVNSKTFPGACL